MGQGQRSRGAELRRERRVEAAAGGSPEKTCYPAGGTQQRSVGLEDRTQQTAETYSGNPFSLFVSCSLEHSYFRGKPHNFVTILAIWRWRHTGD